MRRVVGVIAGGALVVAAVLGPVPRLHAAGASSRQATHADFGAAGSEDAPTAGVDVTTLVTPVTTYFADGSADTKAVLPDGTVMDIPTPPAGFDPLTADDLTLAKYDFPARPTDDGDLSAWLDAMTAFRSDPPPSAPVEVTTSDAAGQADFSTIYTGWGGYWVGDPSAQSHQYVAVKADLVVPTNAGTCSDNSTYQNRTGFWIGLGGSGGQYWPNNLVQQGIECGAACVGSGSSYRPFYEFANTQVHAAPFCMISWTVTHGDTIYQNMSFQTSTNKAFFYLEDQTTGVAHSCSYPPPSDPNNPWHWDLNTAEWVGEAGQATAVDFGSVHFTNARAELSSNSTWVTLGSQPYDRLIQGDQTTDQFGVVHTFYCINSSAIGTGGDNFTDTWHSPGTCYDPNA